MSIEGLGKKFQEARRARNLSLDEAARLTKIRPSRLAEIEADDFSQFPSLAYAKGFLLIYGKFLDVDVTPYLEAFEGSESVTVDGYSYLQDNPAPKPARTPIIPKSTNRGSLVPFVIGVVVLLIGFSFMKLILNLQRIGPRSETKNQAAAATPTASPVTSGTIIARQAEPVGKVSAKTAAGVSPIASATTPTAAPVVVSTPAAVVAASPAPTKEPEIRRAEPVRQEDLVKAEAAESSPAAGSTGLNRVDIKPLKKTYIKVIVDSETEKPAFERWISPADGTVEFRGQHIAVRVLDRDAVQIRKNGKVVAENDADVTIE
ncbi:MAG TPA: helix-turn-helix domain-containing protein [Chthoniobacterales bacterium]|nr:helix-turn-helix domain-containing protein [Chthoniobacterales bacterium]